MLHINGDLAEIKEFFNSIPKLGLGDTSMSQLSQASGNSQMTPYDKFMHKAVVLPLCDIIKLNTTTQCVTVGKIKQLKAAQGGWYYLACHACPKFAKGNQPPYVCSNGHSTETEILRYRILIDVINNGCRATFVLWDRECTELLEVTAAQMRNTLLEAGVTNPLEYPVALDSLVGLKLGFKVKWQPDWDNGTVVSIYRDEAVMLKLLHSFGQEMAPSPSREAPSIKQLDESVDEAIPIEDWTVVAVRICFIYFYRLYSQLVSDSQQDAEITSELNPQPVTPTSATKRIAPPNSTEDAASFEIQQGDHSSTKLKKIIKMEKTAT
ncbi:uncharacterized protein LOC131657918 [Vicia villosa]|uniref:uncharacterized protein LOC131657918 n=1 Tax=Vicia villosa TaxID=3911 RepID=UPI00273CA87B|nr:uncharacterized protein LOC131657918 [Vicia villosa]